jgi:hypothetical protein
MRLTMEGGGERPVWQIPSVGKESALLIDADAY